MTDQRQRSRTVFESDEQTKRAIRMRASLEGNSPADIINAALKVYLADELTLVGQRFPESSEIASIPRKRRASVGDNQPMAS